MHDLPATPDRLHTIGTELEWSPADHALAHASATASPTTAEWTRFLSRTALGLGTVALLAGTIDLVAWNWSELGRFTRLVLVTGLHLGAGGAALALGTRRLPGQLAATAAAVLIGPLLGVIGQTWQTGADAWQLFAWWAVLLVPFLLATRRQDADTPLGFAPLFVVWTVVAGTAVLTTWYQLWPWSHGPGLAAIGACWSIVLAGIAWAMDRFGGQEWVRRTVLLQSGLFLSAGIVGSAVHDHAIPAMGVGAAALVWSAALTYLAGDPDRPDPFAAAVALFAGIVAVATPAVRLSLEVRDPQLPLFLVGLLVLGCSGGAMVWLRGIHRASEET